MQNLLFSVSLFFSKNESGEYVQNPDFNQGLSVLRSVSERFSILYMAHADQRQNEDEIRRAFSLGNFPRGELLFLGEDAEKESALVLKKQLAAGVGRLEDHRVLSSLSIRNLIVHPLALGWEDVLKNLNSLAAESAIIRPIAHIRTGFAEKFGIPRQSGLVKDLMGTIVFEDEFRRMEAVKDLEGFSHLWLIWQFSQAVPGGWRPTVRPPRLGGNRRVGVFASRSPYRPNHLGLSCVKLEKIDRNAKTGPRLLVSGVDMLDQTPIFDIKPYIPIADCPAQPLEGYTQQTKTHLLSVDFPPHLAKLLPKDTLSALCGVLASDPRPGYEDSPDEVYGLAFDGFDVGFSVSEGNVQVVRVNKL